MRFDYPFLLTASKRVQITSGWAEDENGRLRLYLPLEIDGVSVAGLFLRLAALRFMPDRKVTVQLENRQAHFTEPLSRIEWRPLRPHRNGGLGPRKFQFIDIWTSHIHRLEHNWEPIREKWLGDNLPVAVPIEAEPSSFDQLLALVSHEFRITNASEIPIPIWDLML